MKHLVALVALVALVGLAQGQTATATPPFSTPFATNSAPCGGGLPCGPVPWPLPRLPALVSPTPIPTISGAGLAVPTDSSSLPPTPGAGDVNLDGLSGFMATAQAIGTVSFDGTPVNFETELQTMTGNAADFIAYAKAVGELDFGPFTPLVVLLFTAFLLIILYKVTTFMLPVLGVVLGIIRKVIQTILDFLPF